MPANSSKNIVHYWAGIYGNLGHIYSPAGWRNPLEWLPYALDNGAYTAYTKKEPFDEKAFLGLLRKAVSSNQPPMWVTVPDSVGNREETLSMWDKWADRLKNEFGWPLAFVAQDGMTIEDVPRMSDIVFIGGTTGWKQRSIAEFTKVFCRVHVGRVNTETMLYWCHDNGVESCDGTGWFRGRKSQLDELRRYLRWQAGKGFRPLKLDLW